MKYSIALASAATLLLLTACGDTGGNKGAAGGEKSGASSSSAPKDWNAADACAVIDKAKMASVAGKEVSEASVALVNESNGTTAATSECTYIFADGGRASIMLRWSPISDNLDSVIKQTRDTSAQTIEAFGGTVEDVSGLGKAAFWVGKINSLTIFIDDKKFAVINAPSGDGAKEKAIALARQLGG